MDVNRDTPLAKARAIPQSQLDSEVKALAMADAELKASKAKHATNKAGVTTAKAAVVAAKAKLYQSELNLGFAEVRSLVDGVAGVAQMQIGNLVKPDTVLTTVSKVDPIRVYFPVSEKEYLELDVTTRSGRIGNPNNKFRTPALDLILTNGAVHPQKGQISFADRQVDPQTGTIRIAATFPNPGNILRPGQFGRIRALTGEKTNALVVPQRAVTELQGSYQVAVVGPDNKVQIRKVTRGPSTGSQYVIEDGLKPGERVVVEGLAKAVDGGLVSPKAAKAPATKTGG
jgi:membrane fusion protein (multidrug efflux system)